MKKIYGFSLAEALITLLIVCIIAIATVPVITKKKRDPNKATSVLWKVDNTNPKVLIPSAGRDIKLGQIDKQNQGIVIVKRLEFKNRDGQIIGYIDETGENSFQNNNENLEKQEQIISILNTLNSELARILGMQDNSDYNGYNINSGLSSDQQSRIRQVQNEINNLIQTNQ